MRDELDDVIQRFAAEGKSSGQDFVEQNSQRENVASRAERLVRTCLLRREVVGCTEQIARQRELLPTFRVPGQSEIQQSWFQIRPHQNVRGFQIAMHQLVLVEKFHGLRHLEHQLGFLFQVERLSRLEQACALDKFHDKVRRLVG